MAHPRCSEILIPYSVPHVEKAMKVGGKTACWTKADSIGPSISNKSLQSYFMDFGGTYSLLHAFFKGQH